MMSLTLSSENISTVSPIPTIDRAMQENVGLYCPVPSIDMFSDCLSSSHTIKSNTVPTKTHKTSAITMDKQLTGDRCAHKRRPGRGRPGLHRVPDPVVRGETGSGMGY